MSKLRKIKDAISETVTNAIYDILKYIFLSLFVSGTSFISLFNYLKRFDNLELWERVMIGVSISALILLLILIIYIRTSRNFTRPERIWRPYTILRRDVEFIYDGEKSSYKAKVTLKFNRKTNQYYGLFYWSGSGEAKVSVVESNYRLQIIKQRTRYIEYVVNFGRAYERGTTATVTIRGEMNDPEHTFSPYFSTTIKDPTKELNIRLKIDPQKYKVIDMEKETISPQQYQHETAEQIELDADGEYIWNIVKPKLSYQYSINWSFLS